MSCIDRAATSAPRAAEMKKAGDVDSLFKAMVSKNALGCEGKRGRFPQYGFLFHLGLNKHLVGKYLLRVMLGRRAQPKGRIWLPASSE